MSFFDKIKTIFGKKSIESNQSHRIASYDAIDFESHQSHQSVEPTHRTALELGLAAGVAGQSIRTIESSLQRIESLMVTKDWMDLKLRDIIKSYEEAEEKRFQTLVSLINSLHGIAERSPPSLRRRIETVTSKLEKHEGLAPRMQRLINIVKEAGEINYNDLTSRLGVTSVDGVRGLVSLVLRKTDVIEKFSKGKNIWLRYVGPKERSDSSEENQSNQSLLQVFDKEY